jgi:hypothetical protein
MSRSASRIWSNLPIRREWRDCRNSSEASCLACGAHDVQVLDQCLCSRDFADCRRQDRLGAVGCRNRLGGKISDGPEIGLDGATHGLDSDLLDLRVGVGLRLNRELVGKAATLGLPSFVVRGAECCSCWGSVKLIDSTLVIVLHNCEQEIERELASPADALRGALMMLARRGRLEVNEDRQCA